MASTILVPAAFHATPALTQDSIEWTQTLDLPKGRGLPAGVSADMVGVEIGDTYTDAKAKLQRMIAELADGNEGRITETESHFRLPIASGQFVETRFVSRIKLEIDRYNPRVSEMFQLFLSAPSSGAQVYGIERLIQYRDRDTQIRIAELLPRLADKFGMAPVQLNDLTSSTTYQVQFDEGRPVLDQDQLECATSAWLTAGQVEQDIDTINHTGRCDVVMSISINYGLSRDHAASVWFRLIDAERAKANHRADYQFFRDYMDAVREGTAGEGPKL